jgi:hypothetical protein
MAIYEALLKLRAPLILGLLVVGPKLQIAHGVAIDFTTFTEESFPHADTNSNTADDTFPLASWSSFTTSTTASHRPNATPSVFYSPWNALNKRITGTLNGLQDDDPLGIVLGFGPGNATLGDASIATANYLLIDWKRLGQTNNFSDYAVAGFTPFHNLTGPTTSNQGLFVSAVNGIPTADELWGRTDLSQNSQGGVSPLATAATLGTTGYAANVDYALDIRYTASRLVIKIDGVEQFNMSGSFHNGRFGLYTNAQGVGTGPVFTNFTVEYLGDVEANEDVDGNDFLTWQRELGNFGANASDFDGSAVVDGADFAVWQSNFGAASVAPIVAVVIPEPASAVLVLYGLVEILFGGFRSSTARRLRK